MQTGSKAVDQITISLYNGKDVDGALSRLKECPEQYYSLLVAPVFYLIWTTPIFKRQIALVDTILDSTDEVFHILLLRHVIRNFRTVSTDRKDKFYYLIKRTFSKLSFRDIIEIDDLEVLEYVWGIIDKDRSVVKDWDDEMFLSFLSSVKPFIAETIYNIRIEKEKVEKYIDLAHHSKNREALYRLFR